MNEQLNAYILKKYGTITEWFRFKDDSYVVKAGKLDWILDITPYHNLGKMVGYEMIDNSGCVSTMYLEGGIENE